MFDLPSACSEEASAAFSKGIWQRWTLPPRAVVRDAPPPGEHQDKPGLLGNTSLLDLKNRMVDRLFMDVDPA